MNAVASSALGFSASAGPVCDNSLTARSYLILYCMYSSGGIRLPRGRGEERRRGVRHNGGEVVVSHCVSL